MPNQSSSALDLVFHSLADPTRRAVLELLSNEPAPVSELARPFAMALPSFMQHLQVLEDSGLATSSKSGRVRTVRLAPQPLVLAEDWLGSQRLRWETRLDQLDDYLRALKDQNR